MGCSVAGMRLLQEWGGGDENRPVGEVDGPGRCSVPCVCVPVGQSVRVKKLYM